MSSKPIDTVKNAALLDKISVIAHNMKKALGWSCLLVHMSADDEIIGFSMGKNTDWENDVELTYEAEAVEEAAKKELN